MNVLVKMRAAGEPPPRGIQKKGKDWLIPVVRGLAFESETEAEAYLLADNALNIKAGWDKKLLAQMVRRLEKRKVPLTDLGWHRKELDEIMGRILSKAPPTIEIQEQWLVLVTCKNEKDQAKMLERLTKDGYEVRALTS